MNCPNCLQPLEEGAEFCGFCGTRIQSSEETAAGNTVFAQTDTLAVKPKKTHVLRTVIVITSIVLVLAGVAVAVLAWFGFGAFFGPLGGLKRGLYTMWNSDNYTISGYVETTSKWGDSAEETESEKGELTSRVVIDKEKKDLTVFAEGGTKDEKGKTVVSKGESYTVSEDGHGSMSDIDEEQDQLFDLYEVMDKTVKGEKVDWDKEFDDEDSLLYGMDEFVTGKGMNTMIEVANDLSNDKAWLQENLGFEKQRKNGTTEYTFVFSAYDIALASMDVFEGNIDEDCFDDYEDGIRDNRKELDEYEFVVTFRVKGRKLVGFYMEMNRELTYNENKVSKRAVIDLTFSDIGKTEIAKGEIDKVIDKYEALSCKGGCGTHDEQYDGYCWSCAWDKFGVCPSYHILDSNHYCKECDYTYRICSLCGRRALPQDSTSSTCWYCDYDYDY